MARFTGAGSVTARCLLIGLLAASSLACSSMRSDQDRDREYLEARSGEVLETPPDLIRPTLERQYEIPEVAAGAGSPIDRASVLPGSERARLVRVGAQSWLEVDLSPEALWPQLQDFWRTHDYPMERDEPLLGLQETGWMERRPVIPLTGIRAFLGKLFSDRYSGSLLDKFRLRIERGEAEDGRPISRIFVTHWGMQEELVEGAVVRDTVDTVWAWAEPDGALRAELMQRLLVFLGIQERIAQGLITEADALRMQRKAYLDSDDRGTSLVLNQTYYLSWLQLNDELENLGMVIEESNRESGILLAGYLGPTPKIRPLDGEPADPAEAAPGLLARIFSTDDSIERDFRVEVREEPGRTRVRLVELGNADARSQVTEAFYQRLLERFQ